MSTDEGEMFFPEFWTFASEMEDYSKREDESSPVKRENGHTHGGMTIHSNGSIILGYLPVLALHDDGGTSPNPLLARFLPGHLRQQLEKRYKCPTGTSACTSIDRPDSCCATDSTCELIEDTGLGDVGCCAAGETCSGTLSSCEEGYTSCPDNPGGGCCIPGYSCYKSGCAVSATTTVVATATTSTETETTSSTLGPVTIYSTTTVVVYPSTTTTTSTTSDDPSTSSSSRSSSTSSHSSTKTSSSVVVVTTTVTSSQALTCSTGYRSCPASLGGGCCPTSRACGSPTCPALSSTASLSAPVRGTTRDSSSTSAADSSSISYSSCPVGYYACSAYYEGGCCRVGRDCSKTSCPASDSTTLVNTNGVTIAAATGSGVSATTEGETGSCATGWALCPTSDGGGCCPSGYACGSSCTIAASASQTGYGTLVSKVQPSSATKIVDGHFWLSFFITISTILVYLMR